jgi:MarR family transcriptional regulator, organic hydroperoxide resistance regulator
VRGALEMKGGRNVNGARNGLAAAQRLRVGQFHGFAAWLQLVRAYNFVESRISADLREDNLTVAQFDALVGLCKNKKGAVSQQELADHLLVTKGNVVGLIDRLSARGFVERRRSATDRRVNLLEITESSHRLVERVLPRQLELISHLMTTLTGAEADALEGLLSRLLG